MREKAVLGVTALVVLVVVYAQFTDNQANQVSEYGFGDGAINVTLLNNAGVMIETNGQRIYIDPFDIPRDYADKPADAIFVTHSHGDH